MIAINENKLRARMLQEMHLERFLGRYGSGRRRQVMLPLYTEMLAEAKRVMHPRVLFQEKQAPKMAQFGEFIAGAEDIVLAIVTTGVEIEELISELSESKLPRAVILDEIGTEMVLELARQLHLAIRAHARIESRRTSPSFRPGIGRWPLELQQELFRILHAQELGLRLLPSMQMLPQKTVSMIVGIGKDLHTCRTPVRILAETSD